MGPRESEMFWAKVFADHEDREARVQNIIENPHFHPERRIEPETKPATWRPTATAPGADPLLPTPVTRFHRPVEPLDASSAGIVDPTSEEAADDRADRFAFLHEITTQLIRYGSEYVRVSLKQMGYSPAETHMLCKEARLALAEDHLTTDIEEHRAISIARLERIYRQADDSVDPKTALAAQKHLDRVTGVTRDDGAGALGDIAELAKMVCSSQQSIAPSVRRILEAEVVNDPVPPPMQVLTKEQLLALTNDDG